MNEADAFMRFISSVFTLLEPAPANWTYEDMITRRRDEVHACLKCGELASWVMVVQIAGGRRWLDLCMDCYRWVRTCFGDAP